MRFVILAFLAFSLTAATPKTEAKQAFDEWLVAFNANDEEALKSYSVTRLGYSDIAYFKDVRDETGGLDFVETQRDQPHRYIAIMRDRESKALRRVTVELATLGSKKLKNLSMRGLPIPTAEAITALDAFAQRMAVEDRFSGVVAIKHKDELVYQKAFGMADRQQGIPVTLETPFFFASQGKMFTAISVLQLVEAGKLNLNDPNRKTS
jgi:D-alanyl-D-alanine carboxypeptidase